MEEEIFTLSQGKYSAKEDGKKFHSTIGFETTIIDNNRKEYYARYFPRILRMLTERRQTNNREENINNFIKRLHSEIEAMIVASTITDMAPKIIDKFPQDLDQIDIYSNICCIIVYEKISTATSLFDISDKTKQLQILYTVGSEIAKLHSRGIFYKKLDMNSIYLSDGKIKLDNINKNFEFEEIILGQNERCDFTLNSCCVAPNKCKDKGKDDAYSFGTLIFRILFEGYAFFPNSAENGRGYGVLNPIPSEMLTAFKEERGAIWEGLPLAAKQLLGGLLDTYPISLNQRFTRKMGFVEGTESSRGILCLNSNERYTISEILDNEWFREFSPERTNAAHRIPLLVYLEATRLEHCPTNCGLLAFIQALRRKSHTSRHILSFTGQTI